MADPTKTLPQVAIPLPDRKKLAVQIGCICMMLSVAMYGLVFSTLTSPILEGINASGYVSLFSIFAALGVSTMTPIGGKLSDIIGRRNIVVIPGLVCALAGLIFPFVHSLVPLMALRLIISLAQGMFTAAPYIIVSLINERKDVPKAMGMLAAAISVGGFGGSIIAGFLTDRGMMTAAILMPAIPLLAGVALIGLNLPNVKREGKISIDWAGIVLLIAALCGILLALNFGSSVGFGNSKVILALVLGIIALFALIVVESKVEEPLIPLRLFKNSQYALLLLIGFICYFYQNAMNVYAPIAVLRVMEGTTTVAGSLQLPRTIICMILPTICGAWVGKKVTNLWKAMAIATLFVAIPFAFLGMTTPATSALVFMVGLGLTGIAEGFRSVSITPAAQALLAPEDMGIGTSLVNFFNSLSGTVAAAAFGVAYNLNTAADPGNPANIQKGVNTVFQLAALISLIGFVLVIFLVRPMMNKKAATANE